MNNISKDKSSIQLISSSNHPFRSMLVLLFRSVSSRHRERERDEDRQTSHIFPYRCHIPLGEEEEKLLCFFNKKKKITHIHLTRGKKQRLYIQSKRVQIRMRVRGRGVERREKKADVLMCNINIHSLSFWMSSSASPEMIDRNVVCVRWVDIDERRVLVPLVNSIEFSGEILCLLF